MHAPEVEEPEESGWGQLEPVLNELPSNKWACKDDWDKGGVCIEEATPTHCGCCVARTSE